MNEIPGLPREGQGVEQGHHKRQCRYDPSANYNVRCFDVTYRHAEGQDWLARIYQPEGPGPFPAMLEMKINGLASRIKKSRKMRKSG